MKKDFFATAQAMIPKQPHLALAVDTPTYTLSHS